MTHEWGHLVDAWIDKNKPGLYKQIREAITAPDGYSVDKEKAYSVSFYAATDKFEMVAESFGMAHYIPKADLPPVVQELQTLMKGVAKK